MVRKESKSRKRKFAKKVQERNRLRKGAPKKAPKKKRTSAEAELPDVGLFSQTEMELQDTTAKRSGAPKKGEAEKGAKKKKTTVKLSKKRQLQRQQR
jgi:hypothetical protein